MRRCGWRRHALRALGVGVRRHERRGRIHRQASRRAGAVNVNDVLTNYFALGLPMGGWRSRAFGFRHGSYGDQEVLVRPIRSLVPRVKQGERDPLWFPYTRARRQARQPRQPPDQRPRPAKPPRPVAHRHALAGVASRLDGRAAGESHPGVGRQQLHGWRHRPGGARRSRSGGGSSAASMVVPPCARRCFASWMPRRLPWPIRPRRASARLRARGGRRAPSRSLYAHCEGEPPSAPC